MNRVSRVSAMHVLKGGLLPSHSPYDCMCHLPEVMPNVRQIPTADSPPVAVKLDQNLRTRDWPFVRNGEAFAFRKLRLGFF